MRCPIGMQFSDMTAVAESYLGAMMTTMWLLQRSNIAPKHGFQIRLSNMTPLQQSVIRLPKMTPLQQPYSKNSIPLGCPKNIPSHGTSQGHPIKNPHDTSNGMGPQPYLYPIPSHYEVPRERISQSLNRRSSETVMFGTDTSD